MIDAIEELRFRMNSTGLADWITRKEIFFAAHEVYMIMVMGVPINKFVWHRATQFPLVIIND